MLKQQTEYSHRKSEKHALMQLGMKIFFPLQPETTHTTHHKHTHHTTNSHKHTHWLTHSLTHSLTLTHTQTHKTHTPKEKSPSILLTLVNFSEAASITSSSRMQSSLWHWLFGILMLLIVTIDQHSLTEHPFFFLFVKWWICVAFLNRRALTDLFYFFSLLVLIVKFSF